MKTSKALMAAVFALCLAAGCMQEPDYSKSVGENGILSSANGYVMVTINEAAFDEMVKAHIATDKIGRMQLLTSGRAFMVKTGVRVLVIDSVFSKRKIRILEGEHGGRAGWVYVENVR